MWTAVRRWEGICLYWIQELEFVSRFMLGTGEPEVDVLAAFSNWNFRRTSGECVKA
jgi:hypothetical protein